MLHHHLHAVHPGGVLCFRREAMDEQDEYRRPSNEDDDGYDPYSDRPAEEPRYEEDPWR